MKTVGFGVRISRRRGRESLPGRSRGIALLVALLVVALATAAAVALVAHQQIEIRRAANLFDHDRAWQHALGGEQWAAGLLARDREEGERDTLDEAWAQGLPATPVEGGEVSAAIVDLQGRFNLNNLIRDGKPSDPDIAALRRLLQLLDLDPELAAAVADWLDADQETRFPAGAEDLDYLKADPPYRTGGWPLADPEELRLMKGFGPEAVARLLPFVAALPRNTPVNVNTAPAEVLAALAEGMGKSDGEGLVEARGEGGWESVDAFLQHPALAGRPLDPARLAVASGWFRVETAARVGGVTVRLAGVLKRDGEGAVKVVQRGTVAAAPAPREE